jgi:ADP-ribosylglycohydrolase
VPFEFHAPEELPGSDEIEFTPPPDFRRAHGRTPPGTWSDDGAQALCLLDSLLECGRFEPEDFGRRLVRWYEDGYLAVDNRVFDVGITTSRAIQAIRAGTPALSAGPTHESANGNGALMRVLPLALWYQGDDAGLIADARAQSRVTHGHLRSELCCALYCLWARRILQEHPSPWEDALATLRAFYRGSADETQELEYHIRPEAPPFGPGSGYVVDCLRSSRVAVAAGAYEQAVKAAILMGHDTDTTACVTGGIAGLRDGVAAIPERWRGGLRGQDIYSPLLGKLLARCRAQ